MAIEKAMSATSYSAADHNLRENHAAASTDHLGPDNQLVSKMSAAVFCRRWKNIHSVIGNSLPV